MYEDIASTLSIDIDIYRAVTSELKLVTLGELKTVRSVPDLYDYLEIIDAHNAVLQERNAEDERQRTRSAKK